MPESLRASWFGRPVVVLMMNGKSISGTVAEATDAYLVLSDARDVETQVMTHAIAAVKLAEGAPEGGR
jgi:sRNA-binding regulator protein Hfq